MIDEIIDTRREPIGVDLHRRKLRTERRQALSESLAQMLEAGAIEMGRGPRDRRPAKTERDRRCPEVNSGSTTSSIALNPAPS
jgi:hypothetical protein